MSSKKGKVATTPSKKVDPQFETPDESTDAIGGYKLLFNQIRSKLSRLKFKNERQESLWNMIDEKEITICQGEAGTGKTHVALWKALSLLVAEGSTYKSIVFVKPVVEADEKLGYLPGGQDEKLEPYMLSYYYLLEKMINKRRVEKLTEGTTRPPAITTMALAYMRGVNIDNSILIIDEAQNMTIRQMKTLLTRIGENSKFIILGDTEQSDRYLDKKQSGLFHAQSILNDPDLPEVGIFSFNPGDSVRNPVISKILVRFNGKG